MFMRFHDLFDIFEQCVAIVLLGVQIIFFILYYFTVGIAVNRRGRSSISMLRNTRGGLVLWISLMMRRWLKNALFLWGWGALSGGSWPTFELAGKLVIFADQSVNLRLDEAVLIVKHLYVSFIRLCMSQMVQVFVVSSEIRYFGLFNFICKAYYHCLLILNILLNLMAILTNDLALLFYCDLFFFYHIKLIFLLP